MVVNRNFSLTVACNHGHKFLSNNHANKTYIKETMMFLWLSEGVVHWSISASMFQNSTIHSPSPRCYHLSVAGYFKTGRPQGRSCTEENPRKWWRKCADLFFSRLEVSVGTCHGRGRWTAGSTVPAPRKWDGGWRASSVRFTFPVKNEHVGFVGHATSGYIYLFKVALMLDIVTKSPGRQLHVIALWTALSTTASDNQLHPRPHRLCEKHAGNCQWTRCMNRCSLCKRLPLWHSHGTFLSSLSAHGPPSFHGPGHHLLCHYTARCSLRLHLCGALPWSQIFHPSPHAVLAVTQAAEHIFLCQSDCQNRCWSGMSTAAATGSHCNWARSKLRWSLGCLACLLKKRQARLSQTWPRTNVYGTAGVVPKSTHMPVFVKILAFAGSGVLIC